ncbi:PREDICTED: early activation antigen CD69 [Condylura cristata]|uniref:early activation antigen CD69 n=1 Tax=Condylura cristata TaxID=143302 RepID=UPI0003344C66|nr:PREDICTED: early activation antigen CD69 [Condylura cristata]
MQIGTGKKQSLEEAKDDVDIQYLESSTTNPYSVAPHEGSLQVPIPCAVLTVVIITVLVMALIALSVGKYNCPGQYMPLAPSNSHISSCSANWIKYEKTCYSISTEQRNWTSSYNECSQHGATLAIIDSEEKMNFFKQSVNMGTIKYWIGQRNETEQSWKSSNAKELDNWFNLTGSEYCPFLNSTEISSTKCGKMLKWICSKPSR